MTVDSRFKQAEDEYLRLRGQLAVGRITREQFNAALKNLTVQDAQGQSWVMDANTDKWVQTSPPTPTSLPERDAAVPRSLPERGAVPPPPPPPPYRPQPSYTPPPPRRAAGISAPLVVLVAGLFAAIILLCAALVYLLQPANRLAQVTPPVAASAPRVIASSQSRLLTPQEFGANADNLAAAVADLNRAQLQFIADAKTLLAEENLGRAPSLAVPLSADAKTERLDQDLQQVAASAMKVGRLADALARTMASQDKGSDAALKMAEPYGETARLAYALVIQAQNLRDELTKGTLKRAAAVNTIAEYGARLWNPKVSDSTAAPSALAVNPFLKDVANPGAIPPVRFGNQEAVQQFKTELGSASPRLWVAAAQDQTALTISVPAPSKPVGFADEALLDRLTVAAEQQDADRARQAAAAQLNAGTSGAPLSGQIRVPVKAVVFADRDQMGQSAQIPSFDKGTGTTVTEKKNASGGVDLIGDLHELAGIHIYVPYSEPRPSIPIAQATQIVNITIEALQVSGYVPDKETVNVAFRLDMTATTRRTDIEIKYFCILNSIQGTLVEGKTVLESKILASVDARDQYILRNQKIDPLVAELKCEALEWSDDVNESRASWERFHSEATVRIQLDDKPTPTPTATATSTWTSTPTATPTTTGTWTLTPTATGTTATTATPTATGTRTPTLTARAIPTNTPTRTPGPFTLNGTFSVNWSRGYYTTGFIKLTVNPLSGQVSGSINGAGTYGGQEKCKDGSTKSSTSRREFSGDLVGTMDTKTGALNLRGVKADPDAYVPGTVSVSGGCDPAFSINLRAYLALDGTVDLKNHTAQGRIFSTESMDPGNGDWQAGE